jgi:hypothetical protein
MEKCNECGKYHILTGPGAEEPVIDVDTEEEAIQAVLNFEYNLYLYNKNRLN